MKAIYEGHSPDRMQPTPWSRIREVDVNPTARQLLARIYAGPIYGYLRRGGRSKHEAEELTTQFIADVFLGDDLPGRADASKGRFKNYVMRSLVNFLSRQHVASERTFSARLRADLAFEAADPDPAADPAEAFEHDVDHAILEQAIAETRRHFAETGKASHWAAFERLAGQEQPASVIAQDLGFQSAAAMYSAVMRVREKARQVILRAVVLHVDDPTQAEAEVRRIIGV